MRLRMHGDVGLKVLEGLLKYGEIVHLMLLRRTLLHQFIINLILIDTSKSCIFRFVIMNILLDVSH